MRAARFETLSSKKNSVRKLLLYSEVKLYDFQIISGVDLGICETHVSDSVARVGWYCHVYLAG